MPVPAFFWQLSCAAAGLLVCVLPIAVPSLPWADDISSPISSAENPAQAEYANNLSEMIVGLLTIISIGFAFYEFLRHGQ